MSKKIILWYSGIQQWIKQTKIPTPPYIAFKKNKIYTYKILIKAREKSETVRRYKEYEGWGSAILR